ncbi:hypothetical protein [Lactococcus ileimucosae]|uniref:hypothetical protein n=1 Tax=Lactococcus ileimucosae TaxID=2941329 RepID=UPI00204419FA|nr:hypothetical protein [Lactococcus ileimucosae]
MSSEITTEILAKAIDKTKSTVHKKGKKLTLEIQEKKVKFEIIKKSASDDNSQLNAMAIAPIKEDETPDYNNIAVIYAGTNTPTEVGRNGFGTAAEAWVGGLSGEYADAEAFLKQTRKEVSKYNGKITDVAGFSQSGGYMMKMAAEHGRIDGFKTTSFDDWGNNQFETLTQSQKEWIKNHPEALLRYQNDSWAGLSHRDNKYGNVQVIEGIEKHNTLSNYFDGDLLNLDRLAKDGIFAPNMTKEQVEEAAKNWAKKNGDWNPFTDDNDEANERVKEYLKLYGTYATKDFNIQMKKLYQLRAILFESGGGLSANEKFYLDSKEALIIVEEAKHDFETATERIIKLYQDGIKEQEKLWEETVREAREFGDSLEDWEVYEALEEVGFTHENIVDTPAQIYQHKIHQVKQMSEKFKNLEHEIKAKISEIVARDQELAQQLKSS